MSVQYVYLHIQLYIKSLAIIFTFSNNINSQAEICYKVCILLNSSMYANKVGYTIYPTLYREVCIMCTILPGEGY